MYHAIRQPAALWAAIVLCMPILAQEKKADPEEPKAKLAFKRRNASTDEDLRKQLIFVQEIGFDMNGAASAHAALVKLGEKKGAIILPDFGPRAYTQWAQGVNRPDMIAVSWRTGLDCQLGKEAADRLHVLSLNLRDSMRRSVPPKDVRPDSDELRKLIIKADKPLEWNKPEAVPTLVQMLQTENTPVRGLMIELLAKIDGKEASIALAQRAVFDLSPQIRENAIAALSKRPAKEYQATLLEGIRWPWAPAADHAAEALGSLQSKDVVPVLIEMLKEPDPSLPFMVEKKTFVREVVRINHMCNCVLCHAVSTSKDDLVRGHVPPPGEDLPPLYYANPAGLFVRADTTFLRQDFSLIQPVANSGKWPGFQRYDYLLRTRQATAKEAKLLQGIQKEKPFQAPYAQRESVLFALREITKTDMGSRAESWLPLLNPIENKKPGSIK